MKAIEFSYLARREFLNFIALSDKITPSKYGYDTKAEVIESYFNYDDQELTTDINSIINEWLSRQTVSFIRDVLTTCRDRITQDIDRLSKFPTE